MSGDTVAIVAADEGSSATGVNGDQNDNSATDSGAAYVFVRLGNELAATGLPQSLQRGSE